MGFKKRLKRSYWFCKSPQAGRSKAYELVQTAVYTIGSTTSGLFPLPPRCLCATSTLAHTPPTRSTAVWCSAACCSICATPSSSPASSRSSDSSKVRRRGYMFSFTVLHPHLHWGHLADAFIQSDLQRVHLLKDRQQYITVVHKDKNRVS